MTTAELPPLILTRLRENHDEGDEALAGLGGRVLPGVPDHRGRLTALTALFPLLGGENPVGPVVWFLSECWEGLSPLGVFVAALWGFHLVSCLLAGSFAQDVWLAARSSRRLAVSSWSRFVEVWIGSPFSVGLNPSLSLVRPFRRSLPPWLAFGWLAGNSVQLE